MMKQSTVGIHWCTLQLIHVIVENTLAYEIVQFFTYQHAYHLGIYAALLQLLHYLGLTDPPDYSNTGIIK